MICRVCNSEETSLLKIYRPYSDYECEIFDCGHCGSRFAPYRKEIYEILHSNANSTYSWHSELARKTKNYFDKGDIKGLHDYLCETSKFRFIIDNVHKRSNRSKIMEVGCSKGYLSSYFILSMHDFAGTDVSTTAVETANDLFGNHFFVYGDSSLEKKAPFDIIYHVGTIGCIEKPLEFTIKLLNLLKEGGVLIFNSPNISACREQKKIWVQTPPPDLVTIFDKDFWLENFGQYAEVNIYVEKTSPEESSFLILDKLFSKSNGVANRRRLINDKEQNYFYGMPYWAKASSAAKRLIKVILAKILCHTRIIPTFSSDFGLYIVMQKRINRY